MQNMNKRKPFKTLHFLHANYNWSQWKGERPLGPWSRGKLAPEAPEEMSTFETLIFNPQEIFDGDSRSF